MADAALLLSAADTDIYKQADRLKSLERLIGKEEKAWHSANHERLEAKAKISWTLQRSTSLQPSRRWRP